LKNALTAERTVSVSWIAKRWNVSKDTVLRLLESGQLGGYRMTKRGWWRVFESSVIYYERALHEEGK